jgi:hypothetical protein
MKMEHEFENYVDLILISFWLPILWQLFELHPYHINTVEISVSTYVMAKTQNCGLLAKTDCTNYQNVELCEIGF